MKEVMWKRGRSDDGAGGLQFEQASRTNFIPLFDPRYDVKTEILQTLAIGPQRVDLFYFDWVFRPDDLLCQPAYKQALLELEARGNIEVLDTDGFTPKPAKNRRRHQGMPTLGEGHYVRRKH